jgi:hypothetical protein
LAPTSSMALCRRAVAWRGAQMLTIWRNGDDSERCRYGRTEGEFGGARRRRGKGSSASYSWRRAVWVDLEKLERAQE